MNSLSWLIYFAGLVAPLAKMMLIIIVGFLLFGLIRIAIGLFQNYQKDYARTDADRESRQKQIKSSFSGGRWSIITAVVLSLLYVATPSEKTFYMIAASEVAGSVATSDMGKDILSDLQNTIKVKLGQYRAEDAIVDVPVNAVERKELSEINEKKAELEKTIESKTTSQDAKIAAMKEILDLAERAKGLLSE